MNIININSRYELSPWHISFTESVLRSERQFYMESDSLFHISKAIPFYLVDRYAFNNIKDGIYFIDRNDRQHQENDDFDNQEHPEYEKRPSTEALGFYVSKGAHGIPEIYLCTETIFSHTTNEEELTYLLAKVIIHELAHAFMDRHDYGEKDEFYEWMEEASANEITLDYFQDYKELHNNYAHCYLRHHNTKSPYDFVREFILSQPDNYKLGYFLHKNYIHDYIWWRNNKDEIKQKTKAKADWLNYVKSNIRNGGFDRNTLDELTHKVILSDPYNEVPKDER